MLHYRIRQFLVTFGRVSVCRPTGGVEVVYIHLSKLQWQFTKAVSHHPFSTTRSRNEFLTEGVQLPISITTFTWIHVHAHARVYTCIKEHAHTVWLKDHCIDRDSFSDKRQTYYRERLSKRQFCPATGILCVFRLHLVTITWRQRWRWITTVMSIEGIIWSPFQST